MNYWTHAYHPNDGPLPLSPGTVYHASPHGVLQDYKVKNSHRESYRPSALIYAHVRYAQNRLTTRFFHTLAAANRFHKSLKSKQPA